MLSKISILAAVALGVKLASAGDCNLLGDYAYTSTVGASGSANTLTFYGPNNEKLWDYSQHTGDVPSATCLGDGSDNNPCRHCVVDTVNGVAREYCYQTTKLSGTGAPTDCKVEGPDFSYIASEHPDICQYGESIHYEGPFVTAGGICGCKFECYR